MGKIAFDCDCHRDMVTHKRVSKLGIPVGNDYLHTLIWSYFVTGRYTAYCGVIEGTIWLLSHN